MSVISGVRALAFWNPDDGTTVQIAGEAIAGDLEFSKTEVEPDQLDVTGGHPYVGHECTLAVPTYAFAGYPQMAAWSESNTRICCVVVGVEQNVQWYERDRVSLEPTPVIGAKGQAQGYTIRMRRVAPHPEIHQQVNLLAHAGWDDQDPRDEIPDSWSLSNTGPYYEFKGGGIFASDPTALLFKRIPWAASGIEVTASVTARVAASGTFLNLQALAQDGSKIAESSTQHRVGRISASLVLPPQTRRLLIRPAVFGSEVVEVLDPALRVGGSSEYVPY